MQAGTKPEWLEQPNLCLITQLLEQAGGAWRIVGGAVRNHLLGMAAHDIDIVCTLPDDKTLNLLRKAGLKALTTGQRFGVITVIFPDISDGESFRQYEIASLRRDIASDGRHAITSPASNWQEDAARRDFTINALYMDKDGRISDYYGGLEDIQNRILRFVGDSKMRIKEDYLRILRLFRFAASLADFTIASEAKIAADYHASGIQKLSAERIREEFCKWLKAPHAIKFLREASLLLKHLPAPLQHSSERLDALERLERFEAEYQLEKQILLRLALLSDGTASLQNALRLSKAEGKWLAALTASDSIFERQAMNYSLYQTGVEMSRARLLYHACLKDEKINLAEAMTQLQHYQKKAFPLHAASLIEQNIISEKISPKIEGELLGRLLAITEKWWAENDFTEDEASCLAYALAQYQKIIQEKEK